MLLNWCDDDDDDNECICCEFIWCGLLWWFDDDDDKVWEDALIVCEVGDKVANVLLLLLYRDNEFCDDSSNTDVFLERLRGGWSSVEEDLVEVEKPWTKSILRI